MTVIDCTVLADLLVGESELQQGAQRLWQEDPHWISPALWRYELGSVLGKYLRAGKIDLDLMSELLVVSEGLVFETVNEIDSALIARISVSRGLSFYDASYVCLAMSRNLPLRTRDSKILKCCADLAKPMPA